MDEIPPSHDVYVSTVNDPVPEVPRTTRVCQSLRECSRRHNVTNDRQEPSRRQARVSRSINFLLYGITLLIPGMAMIIVYFLVFRIPAADVQWSPADAFVITGAILVGFSIVSECIGLWQFCMSRYESDEPRTSNAITGNTTQYSDSPPSYNTIALDLPDLVISIAQDSEENPPSFASCIANNRPLPGLENQAFNGLTDEEDFSPPPSYPGSLKRKKSGKVVFINRTGSSVRMTTENELQNQPKEESP